MFIFRSYSEWRRDHLSRKRLLFFFIVILAAGATYYFFDGWKGTKATKATEPVSTVSVIDETMGIIQSKGVHPVDSAMLIEGALRGMADVIGDPYSTYLTKDEAAAHKESLAGERIGIGAEITRSNGKFIIVAPVKASPADKAGLLPYDEIVRINGESVGADTLQGVVKRIRGKKGTTVSMTIYRPDLNKHMEISVMRDVIEMKTVSKELIKVKERKIGYISITTFGEETAKEWAAATNKLLSEDAEALIIDVRGNPGGYLHSVGDIAGSLLSDDTVYAYMQDANGALTPLVVESSEDIVFDKKLEKIPLVLLQDKGSASASEVLSGALKDLSRGSIAGTVSFGKGTVQETIDLTNGGEVKLSTHKWLTPKETWIHGKGVEPNIKVEQNELFKEHIRVVAAEYKDGDFNDDVAYGQRLLKGLGYTIAREDGYFDKSTGLAVKEFRTDAKIDKKSKMDGKFFSAMKKQVETYRADQENDKQLQMGLDYLEHLISE